MHFWYTMNNKASKDIDWKSIFDNWELSFGVQILVDQDIFDCFITLIDKMRSGEGVEVVKGAKTLAAMQGRTVGGSLGGYDLCEIVHEQLLLHRKVYASLENTPIFFETPVVINIENLDLSNVDISKAQFFKVTANSRKVQVSLVKNDILKILNTVKKVALSFHPSTEKQIEVRLLK